MKRLVITCFTLLILIMTVTIMNYEPVVINGNTCQSGQSCNKLDCCNKMQSQYELNCVKPCCLNT